MRVRKDIQLCLQFGSIPPSLVLGHECIKTPGCEIHLQAFFLRIVLVLGSTKWVSKSMN
jgi:hypothetical protein